MAYDIPSARVRVGLSASDTSKDTNIALALNVALAAAENYCNRKFLQETETAYFYYESVNSLQLKRYPVTRIFSIKELGEGDITTARDYDNPYKLRHDAGIIHFKRGIQDDEIQVAYEGGYKILPADLELALWGMYDVTFHSLEARLNAPLPQGVQSISIPDVGTISFNQGAPGNQSNPSNDLGPIFGLYKSFLDPYRNAHVL